MKSILTTILLCILVVPLTAQKKKFQLIDPGKKQERKDARAYKKSITDTYTYSGVGGNWMTIQDTRATPILYGAPGATVILGDIKRRPGVIQYFDNANFQYGFMMSLGEGASGHVGRYTGGYSWLKEVEQNSPWSTYLGGGAYLQYTGKFLPSLANSLYHHDLTGAVRIRAEAERSFRLRNKNYILQYRLQVPLVAYVNRWPRYGLSLRGPAQYVAPLGIWNQVISEVSLEGWKSDRNDNRWRLTYQWDWYSFREDIHRLNTASHSLSLTSYLHH